MVENVTLPMSTDLGAAWLFPSSFCEPNKGNSAIYLCILCATPNIWTLLGA